MKRRNGVLIGLIGLIAKGIGSASLPFPASQRLPPIKPIKPIKYCRVILKREG